MYVVHTIFRREFGLMAALVRGVTAGDTERILAAIEDPVVARKILDSLGLPSRPPPVAPARRNPHPTLTEF